jgi:ABC-2 type transport system ATP-binding protein
MARDDDAVVRVRGLRMSYGTQEVLTGVDLDVHPGEVVCLLGPNGAGKTTTIEILEGFRLPSGGDVRVLGEEPATAGDAWRARVGVVLQSWRDHGRWTPRRLLELLGGFYAPYSTPERPRPYDLAWLVDVVGMAEFADRKIATLSGGQRRRLDVAVGIVGRPELLFLDEPTAGFDPQARRDFHDLVHRLSDLEGTTILLTTHDLAEAERLADRILILANGRIVADGSPESLAREVAGTSEVRWACGSERFVHATDDVVPFVRRLFDQHGDDLTDLEVRPASLEETYLAMVQRFESGDRTAPPVLAEVPR